MIKISDAKGVSGHKICLRQLYGRLATAVCKCSLYFVDYSCLKNMIVLSTKISADLFCRKKFSKTLVPTLFGDSAQAN